jgi:hypothetical protein
MSGDGCEKSEIVSDTLDPSQLLSSYEFYEEAARNTKTHAWSQTTWILSLNAGVLAFSVNLYAVDPGLPALVLIELLTAAVGLVLSGFLLYMLQELGKHISNYWMKANKFAASFKPLARLIMTPEEAASALTAEDPPEFPDFCRRLRWLTILFMLAHVGWAHLVLLMYARQLLFGV